MQKPNGVIIYRGPSMIDGKPIVAIATGMSKNSQNEKTGGGLIQTWILREDISPTEAVNNGADASVCGDCPHRGDLIDGKNVGRSCYVTVFQAPLNVWKTHKKGGYPVADVADFAGRGVRLGSYGDPAAVPVAVWVAITARAAYWTGYTHQWRAFPELAAWCMASADSVSDRFTAKALGFRTFRVRGASADREAGEVVCPASAEAGYKTTCDQCRACGGHGAKARADIVIKAHGAASKVSAHSRRIAA